MNKKILCTLLALLSSFSLFAGNDFIANEPINTSKVKINYKTKDQLKNDLKSLVSPVVMTSIFDEIGSGKVSLQFINDYNFKDPNEGPIAERNDDIGYTHGFKIDIYKNLAPQGFDNFYLLISYESKLHTNSDRPAEFQNDYRDVIYLNEDGFYQADVYFKEQNMLEFTVGKMKSNNALYWSAGVGYIEINSDDVERGIFLSSLTQQKEYHRKINEVRGATLREYNYLEQPEESRKGVLLKTIIGKDYEIYQNGNQRSYFRPEATALLTKMSGASYIGLSAEIGHDYITDKLSFLPNLRVSAKYDYQRYSDSSIYRGISFEVSAQSKYFATKLKYMIPQTKYADYLNPLPQDFVERDINTAPIEPTLMWTIEGIIPN